MEKSEVPPNLTLLADLGADLRLYMAPIEALHEQDINARIMPSADHNTLTNNIRRRGRLESVPYCALVDGRVEIVSGHHRIRAARQADLEEIPILLDESNLSRGEIVAKQLAHNRLAGFDDPETLRTLFDSLESIDLILETGLANDLIQVPVMSPMSSVTPGLDIGWQTVSLAFLPHQTINFELLVQALPDSEFVGIGNVEQFENFVRAARGYGRLKKITSFSTAIAHLTQLALDLLAEADEQEESEGADG